MAGFKVQVGIGDLIRLDRSKGAAALMAVFRKHDGKLVETAEAIGIDHATLKRWVVKLGIRGLVERLRAERGLPVARTVHRARPKVQPPAGPPPG
jgi:DNA-binding MarR family transcriptional regulator